MAGTWSSTGRLRLRRGIAIAPADSGRWQVRWDFDEITFLEGDACERVLPWLVPALDGSRTSAELEDVARTRGAITELHEVLDCLEQHCFLASGEAESPAEASPLPAAVETLVSDPAAALARSRTIYHVVCGRTHVADSVVRSLTTMQLQARPVHSIDELLTDLAPAANNSTTQQLNNQAPATVFPVVIEPDWLPQELDRVNERLHALRRPWMLLAAWNRRVLVGPIFVPGETACYACYRRRLASHRRHLAAFETLDLWRRTQTDPLPPSPVLPAIADLAAAWAALEIFHHATGARVPRTLGRVLVYQPEEAQLGVETVLRVPWCPVCCNSV